MELLHDVESDLHDRNDHELREAFRVRAELESLIGFCLERGVRPVIDSVLPLSRARDAFARLAAGHATGKIVLTA